MEPTPPVASLQSVAAACGVSVMTVSRALRNHPRVAASTRRKVLQTAKRLGYAPDPYMARLMARVRGFRKHRAEAVIALVRDSTPGDELLDPAYHYLAESHIRPRAEQHGYRTEVFSIDQNTMPAKRLASILSARGIEGLIISPRSTHSIGAQLDYSCFAAVTLGYGLQQPALHRASTNMTAGILQATAELTARRYRRIGLAVSRWIDDRADHTYSGAMLTYQQSIPLKNRVPLLLFPENDISKEAEIFCAWFRRHEPDAIISFDTYVPRWITGILGKRIPEDLGFVSHDWDERSGRLAGISHRRAEVAIAAVDLLATQLQHNERGVPTVPRQVLIPPRWIDGTSVRAVI